MKFGYVDNGSYRKDETERFVLVSVAVLIHDFSKAMERFMGDILADAELKERVDSRMSGLLLCTLLVTRGK